VLVGYAEPVSVVVAQSFPPPDAAPLWMLHVLALGLLVFAARPDWRWAQPRARPVIRVDDSTIAVVEQISAALASTTLDVADHAVYRS
jgi:hypothetical protein